MGRRLNGDQRELLDKVLAKHGLQHVHDRKRDETDYLANESYRRLQLGADLSEREVEVLSLIADGLSNEQIGIKLQLKTETIKSHVRHLLVKLDASNRAHAVAIGIRSGLLES